MSRAIYIFGALGSLMAFACGGDGHSRPYETEAAGRGGAEAGARASGGRGGMRNHGGANAASGAENDAGSAGESLAEDGGAGGANQAGGGGGGAGPLFPCPSSAVAPKEALCAPGLKRGGGSGVQVDGAGNARLVGITPDELTIAWSSQNREAALYFVADRPNTDEAFDALAPIDTDDDVVGLSPDGLRLVTLSLDRTTYRELVRDARGDDFGAPSVGAFATINAAGGTYRGCVISADDHTLIYTALTDDAEEYPIKVSTRSDTEPWPVGSALTSCGLQRHGALVRQPTALSSDGLTLFFFDPDRQHARAVWRANPSSEFNFFEDLDDVGPAAVNRACSTLYYSGASPTIGLSFASLSSPM